MRSDWADPVISAGRDHRILPLSGATHMAPTNESGWNAVLLERDFLLCALNPTVADVRLSHQSRVAAIGAAILSRIVGSWPAP